MLQVIQRFVANLQFVVQFVFIEKKMDIWTVIPVVNHLLSVNTQPKQNTKEINLGPSKFGTN